MASPAETTPPGLAIYLTYNGSPAVPISVNTYSVVGVISDMNYFGGVTNALVVALPPQNFGIQSLGQGIELQMSGTPSFTYTLEAATNLAPPVNWQPVLTKPADASGNWSVAITNAINIPRQFYRVGGL